MSETTTPRPSFDSYDPSVAEMMTTSAGGMGGIPPTTSGSAPPTSDPAP